MTDPKPTTLYSCAMDLIRKRSRFLVLKNVTFNLSKAMNIPNVISDACSIKMMEKALDATMCIASVNNLQSFMVRDRETGDYVVTASFPPTHQSLQKFAVASQQKRAEEEKVNPGSDFLDHFWIIFDLGRESQLPSMKDLKKYVNDASDDGYAYLDDDYTFEYVEYVNGCSLSNGEEVATAMAVLDEFDGHREKNDDDN